MVSDSNTFLAGTASTPGANQISATPAPVPPASSPISPPRADYISPTPSDILLNVPPQKSKRFLIIIGLVVAVIVALVVVAVVIVTRSSSYDRDNNSGEITKKYAALVTLIQEGPESTREQYKAIADNFQDEPEVDETGTVISTSDPTSTWFIFTIEQGLLTQKEQQSYFSSLRSDFDGLQKMIDNNSEPTDDLSQSIAAYGQAMEAIINSSNFLFLCNSLADAYINNGADGAAEFIQENAPRTEAGDPLYGTPAGRTANSVNRYLKAQIELLEVYSSAGCMNGNTLLTDCGKININNKVLVSARAEQSTAMQIISSSRKLLITTFGEYTQTLANKIEELNE